MKLGINYLALNFEDTKCMTKKMFMNKHKPTMDNFL